MMSIENGCDYYYSCTSCAREDCLVNKQKEEIKRLTEKLEAKCKECREIADDYQEMGTFYYNETVKTAELQKQVDELTSSLACERVVNCQSKAMLDNFHECDKLLRKENAELQKQVNELTEELTSKIKEFELTEKALIKNVNENVELRKQVDELKELAKIKLKNEKNWGKIQTKQAVENTAKEIWDDITSYYFALRVMGNATVELDKLAEFWHQRGVEVE